LIDEIRRKIVLKEIDMIKTFCENYPIAPKPQEGEESFFRKRNAKDQELDIDLSIKSQFNKLRVCDNERYPAHFYIDGNKYILKIFRNS